MTRAVMTGGAGFVGSHPVRSAARQGMGDRLRRPAAHRDRFELAEARTSERFRFVRANIVEELRVDGPVDWVLNLASPASPVDYLEHPIQTLEVGAIGTERCLAPARQRGWVPARLDLGGLRRPAVHPQPETYWGT